MRTGMPHEHEDRVHRPGHGLLGARAQRAGPRRGAGPRGRGRDSRPARQYRADQPAGRDRAARPAGVRRGPGAGGWQVAGRAALAAGHPRAQCRAQRFLSGQRHPALRRGGRRRHDRAGYARPHRPGGADGQRCRAGRARRAHPGAGHRRGRRPPHPPRRHPPRAHGYRPLRGVRARPAPRHPLRARARRGADHRARHGAAVPAALRRGPDAQHYRSGSRAEGAGRFLDALELPGDAQQEVEIGPPEEIIVSVAERETADLIVVSPHTRSAIARFFMGSTTDRILRNAPCPVLVYREARAAAQTI